ncbi:ATP-binding cassette domain-containing protein [Diplocloster hominis]|uniref:ATP-binding cassette domain-containing protein n=1 Tax=Diplocloster hominis TaxID=3079010 RepID=UPI0031B9BF28
MRRELFRAREIVYMQDDRPVLDGLNLNVFQGESLGIFSVSKSIRNALVQVLVNRIAPASGILFLNGVPHTRITRETESLSVIRILPRSSLVSARTVWENILVIRRRRHFSFLMNPAVMRKQAQSLLDEYGLQIDAGCLAGGLTPAQHYMVEILKAYVMGAQIILIDEFPFNFTADEYRKIRQLMKLIQDNGISFLVISSHMEAIKATTDRIAFLSRGKVLRIFCNIPEQLDRINRMVSVLLPSTPVEKNPVEAVKKERVCQVSFDTYTGQPLEVELYRGEITIVIDLTRTSLKALSGDGDVANGSVSVNFNRTAGDNRNGHVRPHVLAMSFGGHDQLAAGLAPADNLCMGVYRRFSTLGVIKPRRIRSVKQEFSEWYENERVMEQPDSRELSRRAKAAIVVYRMMLRRPDVLIGRIVSTNRDVYTYQIVRKGLLDLSAGGAAVCLLLSGTELLEDFADRYIMITENGIHYNVPYERTADMDGGVSWSAEKEI